MKTNLYKLLLSALLVCGLRQASAQQDVLVSQYMFNHLLLNPAYAGTKDYMMSSLLYRKQWVNLDGAPTTQVGSIHGPLGLTNFGWGALISNDHIGVTNRTDAYANGAYHVKLKGDLNLSLGIRAGGGYYAIKNSDLKYWDQGDKVFNGDRVSKFLPNIGAGAYLYSTKYYAGLSAPTLISYDPEKALSLSLSGNIYVPRQVRHCFLTAGMVYEMNPDVVLKPSFLLKYVGNAPVEVDLNMNVLLSNILWVGASYRTNDAIVGILEFQVNRKLRIGYSYDYTLSDIKNYSAGSHEFMVGYDFGYDIMKMKTPRYF
jgi:type IX secretion system PorP/SprF family membrane protein